MKFTMSRDDLAHAVGPPNGAASAPSGRAAALAPPECDDQVLEWLGSLAWEAAEPGWEQLVELARGLGGDPELAALDDGTLGDRVCTQAAQLAAATCRWLEHLAEFVVRGIWADQGARTPAAWLSWRIGLAPSTAREHVRVALQLRELPLLRERFRAGEISYSKVRALTRVAVPDIEPMLLTWADAATASDIERIVGAFRRTQRAAGMTAEQRDEARHVRRRATASGMVDVVVRVLPEEADEIVATLERLAHLESSMASDDAGSPTASSITDGTASAEAPVEGHHADGAAATSVSASAEAPATSPEPLPSDAATTTTPADTTPADTTPATTVPQELEGPVTPHRPRGSQLADALVHTLVAAAGAAPPDTSGADRHTLVLTAALSDLAEPTDTGPHRRGDARRAAQIPVQDRDGRVVSMDRRVLRRLACEAGIVVAALGDDGSPLDLGRRDRRLSVALRRAVLLRDRSCRFPGCGSTRNLHVHHVRHWADGGPTDLANLVLVCATHHRFVHEHGWQLTSTSDGRFAFAPPGAEPLPTAWPLPGLAATGMDGTAGVGDAAGDHLRPANWAGPRGTDLDLTVAVLQQELRRSLPAKLTMAA